ncbi:MAG: class II aldolase/adducin family protein [Chloroflexota bacterium]
MITPAIAPGRATTKDLLTITLDEQRVAGSAPQESETPLHLAIYRARPDVGAICRTYSRYAVIMGTLNRTIHVAHGFGGMLGTVVPVHSESDLVVNAAMGDRVTVSLGKRTALLLRGNGALAVGPSIERALINAVYLEESAMLPIMSAALDGPVPFAGDELERRAHWYEAEVHRAWDYYAWKFA